MLLLLLLMLLVLLGRGMGREGQEGAGRGGGGPRGGGGGGDLLLLMTCSDPKTLLTPIPHNPAGSKKIYIEAYRSHPAGRKTIIMRGVIKKVR